MTQDHDDDKPRRVAVGRGLARPLRTSLETSRVTLYLKGERPAQLTSLLADLPVPVDVAEAPYTRDELDAQRARILADPANVLGVTEITGIGIPPEGDRITVTVAPSETVARRRTTDTGVPVEWSTGEGGVPAAG